MTSEFLVFAEMERCGWSDAARASGYVQLFASAPDQAIESLLDAAEADRNLKALDLCCGQGNVAEALLSRGCQVVGVDFSPAMLAFARQRARKATFVEARTRKTFLLPIPNLTLWSPIWVCAISQISLARLPRRDVFFVQVEDSR
jgi:SAM-dependent methyltransferase